MLWEGKAQCIVGKKTTCGMFAASCILKLYSAAEPDILCVVVRINSWEYSTVIFVISLNSKVIYVNCMATSVISDNCKVISVISVNC